MIYIMSIIHKQSNKVCGKPAISNCGTTADKVLELLGFHLKLLMQNIRFFISNAFFPLSLSVA